VSGLVDPQKYFAAFMANPSDAGLAMRLWSLLHLEIWYQALGRKMESST
jgi:hypothetical protein